MPEQGLEMEKVHLRESIKMLEEGRSGEFLKLRIPEESEYSGVETTSAQEFLADRDFGDIPEQAREQERAFVKKIFAALEAWAQEENVLVLWDIDETLFVTATGDKDTPRPSISGSDLLDQVKGRFPSISHGIFSDRGGWDEGKNNDVLKYLEGFIDRQYIFRSMEYGEVYEGLEESSIQNDLDVYMGQIMELDDLEDRPDSFKSLPAGNTISKWLGYKRAQAETGMNVKVIDDNAIALLLGRDAVHLGWDEKFRLSLLDR